MPTISDPTKLDKEELLAEWAVREEELRLQFESLRTAQTQSQLLLQRYERIFAFCPLPLMVMDNRGQVQEVNNVARQLLSEELAMRSNHLQNLLVESSRLSFAQTLRGFMNDDAPKADELIVEFKAPSGRYRALIVALDGQQPPDSYVVMLTDPDEEGDSPQ